MSTYRVPKCGRHFVKFDDVTIYPVLVVARTGPKRLCCLLDQGVIAACKPRKPLLLSSPVSQCSSLEKVIAAAC